MDDGGTKQGSHYNLSSFWIFQSGVGVLGTILNTLIIIMFHKERHLLTSSVNTMIRYVISDNSRIK